MKAASWLQKSGIEVENRDIVTNNPNEDEISDWVKMSGIPVAKFFNTSGLRYKAFNLKDVVKVASQEELIKILASEGKLIKRPLLVTDKTVLLGFKEEEWAKTLLSVN